MSESMLADFDSLPRLEMIRCARRKAGSSVVVTAGEESFVLSKLICKTQTGRVQLAPRCHDGVNGALIVDSECVLACKMVRKSCITTRKTEYGEELEEDPLFELRIMQHLSQESSHPGARHVAHIHHVWCDDTWVYAFMDFGRDGDLFQVLDNSRTYGTEGHNAMCRSFMRQLLLGLDYIQSKGISHRDLSLENVVVSRGALKIIDFGVAAHSGSPSSPSRGLVGKRLLIAPEVFRGEAYNGFAADMWSLGVMMFMMLTGRSPYASPDPSECAFMRNIMAGKVEKRRNQVARYADIDAGHLCFALMAPSVCDRPSPAKCLSHHYFEADGDSAALRFRAMDAGDFAFVEYTSPEAKSREPMDCGTGLVVSGYATPGTPGSCPTRHSPESGSHDHMELSTPISPAPERLRLKVPEPAMP